MNHHFQESLRRSQTVDHHFERKYRQKFGHRFVARTKLAEGPTLNQESGWDACIVLNNGTVLRVEEKADFYDSPRMVLETQSSGTKPGWMTKELTCDYLAYYYVARDHLWFLPWPLLKNAYEHHQAEWHHKCAHNIGEFRYIDAQNHTYRTRSLGIPLAHIEAAIVEAIQEPLPQIQYQATA